MHRTAVSNDDFLADHSAALRERGRTREGFLFLVILFMFYFSILFLRICVALYRSGLSKCVRLCGSSVCIFLGEDATQHFLKLDIYA